MAIRFLYSGGRYLRPALFILACFPGLVLAGPRYVKPTFIDLDPSTGLYKLTQSSTWVEAGRATGMATINTGAASKAISLPATVRVLASQAPKALLNVAKANVPLTMASILVAYLTRNASPNEELQPLQNIEGQWGMESTGGGDGIVWGTVYRDSPNCPNPGITTYAYSGPSSCGTMSSRRASAYANCNYGEPPNIPITYSDVKKACVFSTGAIYQALPYEVVPPSPINIIPPNLDDWERWNDESGEWEPMTDPELRAMADPYQEDPLIQGPGLPADQPLVSDLPKRVPLSEPYQDESGNYRQPTARITPGPDGTVGVEIEEIPVTGPEGIPDPTGEPPVKIDNPVDVTGDVSVELCKPGDTNLACVLLGTPEGVEIEPDTFDLDFDHSPVVFTDSTCPTGPTASTPWGPITIDMYWPCEFATAIKPIILALGAFAAMAIFVGGLRTS